MGVHLISEAERLAYADRDKYVADTDFVPLPGGTPNTLLNSDYLAQRAALISEQRSMGTAKPGEFGASPSTPVPVPEHGTSQISVVDAQGNAAALTTTVESAFGSFHMVDGFILNNQLTDFSAEPAGPDGVPVANRVEPGKRPRSTMAPTLMFDKSGDRLAARCTPTLGSPGGSVIIQFVVKTVVGMLDWGLDPQQAVSAWSTSARPTRPKTNVGGEHPNIDTADNGDHDPLVQGLRKLGHQVDLADQSSGLSAIVRGIAGLDRRRGPAPRGAGDGRPPVTARVTRLTESDWRLFAGVRLRALTDSLGADDPQYRQESTFTAAQWRRRLRDHAQFAALLGRPPGRADRCTAGERRNRLPVLTLARSGRPRPRPGPTAGRRGRGLGARPAGAHRHARVAVDNTVARGVYESLGFAPVAGDGVNARDEVAMSLSVS